MAKRTCSVEGCEKPSRSRGWCPMHYYRFRKNGSPEALQKFPRKGLLCVIDDCQRERYSGKYGWCRAHYLQWRAKNRLNKTPCTVAGCEDPQHANELCAVHDARMRRTGTTDLIGRHRSDGHYKWVGDEATYGTIHRRLRVYRGSASEFDCDECGAEAKQWAYDHMDPNEKQSNRGPFSVDLSHYRPLCIPCHKTMDLEHRRARS